MIALYDNRELVGLAEDLPATIARTIAIRRDGILLAVCSPSPAEGLSLLRAAGQRRRRGRP